MLNIRQVKDAGYAVSMGVTRAGDMLEISLKATCTEDSKRSNAHETVGAEKLKSVTLMPADMAENLRDQLSAVL